MDLDDTLLDYSGGVDECWSAACETVAAPAGIDTAALIDSLRNARRWFWDDPERHRLERVDMPGAWRKIVAHGLERMDSPNAQLAAARLKALKDSSIDPDNFTVDPVTLVVSKNLQSLRPVATPSVGRVIEKR